MPRILIALGLVAALAVPAGAADAKYALTGDNTKVTFVGKKADGKHTGGFGKLTGSATVAGGDPTKLEVTVEIETESIFSDDEKLTGHLKNADFFDVKNQPKATFKSTKVEKGTAGYTVTGDLTLLGKTKSVSFPATITEKDGKLEVAASFAIDRTQWGMTYGKGKIDDNVELGIKVEAKK
ncbi:YceI family protein OS=Planctomyces limnophilus (strain ATCC 43296 / DSM 3776 / IFAM 1008 / 290) GN=Plim_3690 PE=4 SV=1: YceI [Gemmata massiliana]|uniref:Lipid/polyisoprenoid-binding YceI-like domain-containing protein n=1 Tax=Gemmata massiliana TaxID=1210884 RepID=A0A6P2DAF2_9BACT|nr:YceI family protein [Gemmata massiliana]VTR97335.1 YceI family protein OS=Planctomyces limnophilus (strain ATCC 43296 / DSM 3776 / IFAM 1008 / 290) GN=Plim_3690 PE=4 SV=1: YceI [Gemmata massiliana]